MIQGSENSSSSTRRERRAVVAALPFHAAVSGTVGPRLGADLAPIVPTVFSAAGNLPAGAGALGWVVTISYVGGILGPAVIGFVARLSGLRAALGICAALAAVAALCAGKVSMAEGIGPGAAAAPPHAG